MDFKTNLNFLSWRTRFAMDRAVSLLLQGLSFSFITAKPICPTWQLLITHQCLNLAETRYFQLNTGNGLSIARAQPNTAAPASLGLPALGTHRAQRIAGCSFRNPPLWRHLPQSCRQSPPTIFPPYSKTGPDSSIGLTSENWGLRFISTCDQSFISGMHIWTWVCLVHYRQAQWRTFGNICDQKGHT